MSENMNHFAKLSVINVNDKVEKRDNTTGRYRKTHGMRREKIYAVWCSMKERCSNPNNQSFASYGGRGIRVCEEWQNSFSVFVKWANSSGFNDGLTIDRIDNNGSYCAANCRWVTRSEQNRNYRRNHFLTFNGETLCLADMADKYGVNRATVLFRIKGGKTIEEALSKIDGRTTRWAK